VVRRSVVLRGSIGNGGNGGRARRVQKGGCSSNRSLSNRSSWPSSRSGVMDW
jgi:hypothetical protein